MATRISFVLTLLVSVTLSAQSPKYVYVSEGCAYLTKEPSDNNGTQVVIGDRLEILGDMPDYYKARMYGGKEGLIAKGKVKPEDPKTYFSATVGGRKVVEFLRGPAHCSFIDELQIKVGLDTGGQVDIPIPRISKLETGPKGLKVWTDDGEEYDSSVAQWKDSWGGSPGRFYYGEQLAHVKTGHGTELPIASDKIGHTLLLEKIKVD
jgi:hypothetical protein